MDDPDELLASEFVTDNEDQDSLDERIDSEQRLRNQQLWSSFQNAACCITELYKDRGQTGVNVPLWVPFQHAASNLTTLYKDCIESQRRFAKIGYQIGRRKRLRELSKMLKKHKLQAATASPFRLQSQQQVDYRAQAQSHAFSEQISVTGPILVEDERRTSTNNHVSSILAVNQLNLDCDETAATTTPSDPTGRAAQASLNSHQIHQLSSSSHQNQQHLLQQPQQSNMQTSLSNNEDHLLTFQQALSAQTPVNRGGQYRLGQNKRPNSQQASGQHFCNRGVDHNKSEEDRLLELNQFLSEEYHRHVGSRKRTSAAHGGGGNIKRFRE